MRPVRVLIVEDMPKMSALLQRAFREDGYAVDVQASGSEAVWMASECDFDAVILDLGLPDIDGFEVCRQLRERGRWMPILMLTAREAVHDLVRGLDSGADDYVTKPFGTEELLARLRSVLRRGEQDGAEPIVSVGDLEIDLAGRSVRRDGSGVHLTPIEFDLLRVLATHRGKLVTHNQLLQEVWGPGYEAETHYLRVHFAHMRSKLEPEPSQPRYLITEPGVGYRLREQT